MSCSCVSYCIILSHPSECDLCTTARIVEVDVLTVIILFGRVIYNATMVMIRTSLHTSVAVVLIARGFHAGPAYHSNIEQLYIGSEGGGLGEQSIQ